MSKKMAPELSTYQRHIILIIYFKERKKRKE